MASAAWAESRARSGGEVRMEGAPAELATSPDFIESFLGGGRERGSDRGTGAPA
jgi:hypothetical protein